MLVPEVEDVVRRKILDLGGCRWCALRFTAPSWERYAALDDTEESGNLCPICLGVLQHVDAHIQEIFAKTAAYAPREHGDDASCEEILAASAPSLNFSIAIPGQLAVRQAAAAAAVVESSQQHTVKDALRAILRCKLGTGSSNDNHGCLGALTICLEFLAGDQSEYSSLPRPPQPMRGERRRGGKRQKRGPATVPAGRVESALDGLSKDELAKLAQKLILLRGDTPVLRAAEVRISCVRESVYIVGRYRKKSRVMPQSAWTVDGSRKGVSSVEEVLAEALKPQFTSIGELKFLASGREDCNVRMLGTGRPFSVEIVNPVNLCASSTIDLEALATRVVEVSNVLEAPVEVLGLRLADKNESSAVDASAGTKRKTYACVVWFERPVSEQDVEKINRIRDLQIVQKTPVRVMHSRSLADRERTVYSLHLDLFNRHYGTLRLTTAAGTYIKEFVHGDFGRTTPSLGDILATRADILQLDVFDIEQ